MLTSAGKLEVRQRSKGPIARIDRFVACAIAVLVVSACAAEVKQLPPTLDPASAEAPEGAPETPRSLAGPLPREAMPLAQFAAGEGGMADHADTAHTDEHAAHGRSDQQDSAARDATEAGTTHPKGHGEARHPTIYTCPMHPEVRQDRPGSCPKCGMKLVRELRSEDKERRSEDKGGATDRAGSSAAAREGAIDSGKSVYTCPMHPEVRQDRPGKCPKCGMKLVPEAKSPGSGKHDGHP